MGLPNKKYRGLRLEVTQLTYRGNYGLAKQEVQKVAT